MSATIDDIQACLDRIIFPGVLAQVVCCEDLDGELLPEEQKQAEDYGEKRCSEFVTSRLLARDLMSKLGVQNQPLLSGEDREPLWPDGIIGSITHSKGFVIVAVAKVGEVKGLGVDLELRPQLEQKFFERILRPEERELLANDPVHASREALLTFSAKEAFYKAQFAITGEFVGFEGLSVSRRPNDHILDCKVKDETITAPLANSEILLHGVSEPGFALTCCRIS